ncbi:MAG: ABC transporter ATP-binding protein, partial [Myxococcota bacterium]
MKALQVEGLSYRYGDGTTALHDIRFSVEEGEKVGLIGPNGAGKSTLFLHLNGLLPEHPATACPITVFGVPVTQKNFPQVRSSVGLLFQDPDDQLFCPTVWEDVAFGPGQKGLPKEEISRLVENSMARVGLLPSMGKKSPHHLSGGEKRRVCIAGVLACNPGILVLDEPTSGLDPRGRRELGALLKGLPVTQIIATHDLEFLVGLCSRVILMDSGRIVAQGALDVIMSDETLMLEHGLEKPHILRHQKPDQTAH